MNYRRRNTNYPGKARYAALVVIGSLSSGIAAPAAAQQQIEARINRVGLFAGAEPAVRSGSWSFVDVGLRLRGNEPFDGELRVDQLDQDGDVATSVLPVALAAGAEWRDYHVYYVPHDVNDTGNRIRVRLYDADGRRVELLIETGAVEKELIGPSVSDISDDELLIVDLSIPRKLAHIGWLDERRRGNATIITQRRVRPMLPQELPQRWQGLEAVDAMVWDDADPAALSAQQIEALIDWVKAGGRLLISAGRNWQTLANSPLASALPATIKALESRTEALEFLDIVKQDDYGARLSKWYLKHPLSRVVMEPVIGSVPVPAQCANPQIVHRRMLGRGVVTLVGAPLQQLLPIPDRLPSDEDSLAELKTLGDVEKDFIDTACRKVVGSRLLGLPQPEEEKNAGVQFGGIYGRTDLFAILRQTIAFESVGASFLIFAIFFAICYTITATVAINWFLRRRSWLHHSWSAFAIVSLAFTVIGFGMVWMLRGVTTRLWQTTIVDGQSANDHAHAVCLFGVRTPDHTRLNLKLPVGRADEPARVGGPIRVVPEGELLGQQSSKYAAPENYRCDLAGTRLLEIPVRATLKEFEGHWHGALNGTLDGKLIALPNKGSDRERIRYEFGEGSYLRNNLPVALENCYLLETEEEMAGEEPVSLTKCYFLDDLPAGSQLEGEELRRRMFYILDPAKPGEPPKRIPRMPLLSSELKNWSNKMPHFGLRSSTDDLAAARQLVGEMDYYSVLLLSFFDLIRHESLNVPLRRGHGRTLDCTRQLTRNTAILVGYSQEAAPAVLEADLVTLRPNKARTIYRFLIPVVRSVE